MGFNPKLWKVETISTESGCKYSVMGHYQCIKALIAFHCGSPWPGNIPGKRGKTRKHNINGLDVIFHHIVLIFMNFRFVGWQTWKWDFLLSVRIFFVRFSLFSHLPDLISDFLLIKISCFFLQYPPLTLIYFVVTFFKILL